MTETSPPRRGRFPWYKERLKWKYIQSLDGNNKLCSYKWQFLPHTIDDFRTGLPIKRNIKRSKRSIFPPAISTQADKHDTKLHYLHTISRSSSCNQYNTVYSRTAPRIQKQKCRIEEAQLSLQKHPLGLYPHLEDSLPINISDEVIEILDPYLKQPDLNSMQFINDDESSLTEDEISTVKEDELNTDNVLLKDSTVYQLPLKKSDYEELLEAKKTAEQSAISPEQEQAVNNIMMDLVQWINGLVFDGDSAGDKDDSINETTIKKLFTSDYESRPVLTAPIHVVHLSNIPQELQSPRQTNNEAMITTGLNYQHIPTKCEYLPKIVKSKYGAWYLDIKFWKYTPTDEPLLDPKEVNKINDVGRKAKNLLLDNAILDTHGAVSFKDFITLKGKMTMPKFLKSVGQTNNCRVKTKS